MLLNKKNQMFKTVTGDNGSEFATLTDFEKYGMSVYFTRIYPVTKAQINVIIKCCANSLKGKPISTYTTEDFSILPIV